MNSFEQFIETELDRIGERKESWDICFLEGDDAFLELADISLALLEMAMYYDPTLGSNEIVFQPSDYLLINTLHDAISKHIEAHGDKIDDLLDHTLRVCIFVMRQYAMQGTLIQVYPDDLGDDPIDEVPL